MKIEWPIKIFSFILFLLFVNKYVEIILNITHGSFIKNHKNIK